MTVTQHRRKRPTSPQIRLSLVNVQQGSKRQLAQPRYAQCAWY
jgi:hypothetical protein